MDVNTLNAKDKERLRRVVEASATQQGFMNVVEKDYKKLAEAGFILISVDPLHKDTAGNPGCKVSPAGLEAWTAYSGAGGAGAATNGAATGGASKPKRARLEIDTAVPMPTGASVRAARESIYPFDGLEIGQSFHVAKTAEMEDPEKALGSSVSAAKRKFSKPLPGQHKTRKGFADNYELTRNFRMFRVTDKDPKGEGVRIYRIDLPPNPRVDGSKGAAVA